MSDQALEQSPQEKLMAMLDEVPEEQEALEAIEEQLDEQDEQETDTDTEEATEDIDDAESETDEEDVDDGEPRGTKVSDLDSNTLTVDGGVGSSEISPNLAILFPFLFF